MIRVTDITVKGAALAAVAAGDFSSLPIHNPAVECASRERIEGGVQGHERAGAAAKPTAQN